MSSRLKRAMDRGLIKTDGFVEGNLCYEVITGSYAYGCSNDNSDMDIYGFTIAPKEYIFPHINGYIRGFDTQVKNFEQFQKHHVIDKEARKEYDFSIFGIVKFFKLCMDCNPNMVDTLFVPGNCVLKSNNIGQMVREARHLFLCKKAWHKFKGYAYSQMHKMKTNGKDPETGEWTIIGKRRESIEKYGYDVKYAVHLVRLLLEIEQILTEGDLDLRRHSKQLTAIRSGEWLEEQCYEFFYAKEKALEDVYNSSKLTYKPREKEIKQLLINCLEEQFGSLEGLVMKQSDGNALKQDLLKFLEGY